MGGLRFDLSFRYRAIPPHTGALLQQQQMQASILILWLMGRFLSYSGARESQFTKGFLVERPGKTKEFTGGDPVSNLVVFSMGEAKVS